MNPTRRGRRLDSAVAGITLIAVAGLAIGGVAAADLSLFGDEIDRKPLGRCGTYVFDRTAWRDTENPNQEDSYDRGDPSPAQNTYLTELETLNIRFDGGGRAELVQLHA